MTKSVTKTASKSPFRRNVESAGCRGSEPSQQAKELSAIGGRTMPKSGDSTPSHKLAQPDSNLNTTDR